MNKWIFWLFVLLGFNVAAMITTTIWALLEIAHYASHIIGG